MRDYQMDIQDIVNMFDMEQLLTLLNYGLITVDEFVIALGFDAPIDVEFEVISEIISVPSLPSWPVRKLIEHRPIS